MYVSPRAKTCLCFPHIFSHIFHLCVPYVALNQQQIYPHTVFTDCVSNGGTLYSRWGKQRFYYRSQKPETLVYSNALVTHSIPFPNHAVPLKFSNVSFPFDLYFSTRGVWNKNGKIKTLQQASESVTGSDPLDWKRQQEFYFSYSLLYHSIDICFSIRVLDIGFLFFKRSLPRPEKLLILELISCRRTTELNAKSPLNKSFYFCCTKYKNL